MAIDYIFTDIIAQASSNTGIDVTFDADTGSTISSGLIIKHVLGYNASSGQIEFDISTPAYTEFWMAFNYENSTRQVADRAYLTFSGPTQDLFRLVTVETTTAEFSTQRLEIFNGSTWDTIEVLDTDMVSNHTDWPRWDVNFKLDNTVGFFKLWKDGVLVHDTGLIDTLRATDTTITKFSIGCTYNTAAYPDYWGFITVDDLDTRGLVWEIDKSASDGFHTGWSGAESAVGTYFLWDSVWASQGITAIAPGEKRTFNFEDIPTGSYPGYAVESVVLGYGGQVIVKPGMYVKPLLRIGLTDYTETGQVLTVPDSSFMVELPNNPSTGSPWASITAVNDMQIGMQSSLTA